MLFASHGEGISQPNIPRLAQLLAVFMAYSLTGWLGLFVPFENDRVTLFWLPSGIAMAAYYRWSFRIWPAVFLAALSLQTYSGADVITNLVIATGNTIAPLFGSWLLGRTKCDLTQLNRTNTVWFLLLSALAMLLSASVGGFTLNNFNQGSFHEGLYTALIWWMGDSLGVFLITPFLININRINLNRVAERKLDFIIILAVSFAVGLCCFPLNNFSGGLHLPIVFTSFVCVAWAALSFGLLGCALTTIGFSFLAIWSSVNQLGPFSLPSQQLGYWMIWIYTVSMTILGLMITAAHTEIATTTHQLDESTEAREKQKSHLEAVLHAIPDLLFEIDRQGQVLSLNGNPQHHNLTTEDLLGKNLSETLPSTSVSVWMHALSEADNWGISQGKSVRITQHNSTYWYELSIAKRSADRREDDRFICLARDITKRINTHQADLANEQRFRNIFETTRNIAVQGYNRSKVGC